MTTTVTVKTYDWPALVTTVDSYNGETKTFPTTVPPHSENTFNITETRSLSIEELEKPAE